VFGLTEPAWPQDAAFLSSTTLNNLYDLAHYVRLGQCEPVIFTWWHNMLRPTTALASAERAWERMKVLMRQVGVPFEVLYKPDSDLQVRGLRFSRPNDFVSIITGLYLARNCVDDDG